MNRKAAVYIDGQNIFHGLVKQGLPGRCFDFKKYSEHITAGKNLSFVKYYGARYPREINLGKHNGDDAFFKSLANMGVRVVEGRFLSVVVNGRKIPREKGVDVRLATDLIIDAFYSLYDDAYILSADTDLLPAIVAVKKQFAKIRIYNFSFQKLNAFENSCDGCLQIYHSVAKKFINPSVFKPTEKTIVDLKNKFNTQQFRNR